MKYEVRYSLRALEQIKALRAYDQAAILERIDDRLTTEPTRTSKTAIKLLKQPAPTQYRLRANDFRIFYDVEADVVTGNGDPEQKGIRSLPRKVHMTVRHIKDVKTPIGDFLKEASKGGLLLDTKNHKQIAMIPLDDDLLDYLLERSPKLIQECKKIRAEMKRGKYITHEEVKKMFAKELGNARANGHK